MSGAVGMLLRSLKGTHVGRSNHDEAEGAVGRLARAYEIARNALEYRAEHLVKRASIERILKRQLAFGRQESYVTDSLIQELVWARYLSESDLDTIGGKEAIQKIVSKYMEFLHKGGVDKDWVLSVMSSEVEELLNPNDDYQEFTTFAFNAIKRRVSLTAAGNLDLLLYVAVDRVYSQSDDARVSHHLFKLISAQVGAQNHHALTETWKLFVEAKNSKVLNVLTVFVRKQMGPLVLIRDIYFSNPTKFKSLVEDRGLFAQEAEIVLQDQLLLMRGRISTATSRSISYVFLTKMVFGILVEVPLDRWIHGKVEYLSLAAMILVPVLVMWVLVSAIKLPGTREQEKLIARSIQIIFDFDATPREGEMLMSLETGMSRPRFVLFYSFYSMLFLAIFAVIVWVLTYFGFSFLNVGVFIFFLSVIMFFAYRIRQTAEIYTYYPRGVRQTSLWEMVALPMVVVGGAVSREVSKLNFLVFIMDFVLEAPFKMILNFLDNWTRFLSVKKDEVVG